jgi:hypothetical protein
METAAGAEATAGGTLDAGTSATRKLAAEAADNGLLGLNLAVWCSLSDTGSYPASRFHDSEYDKASHDRNTDHMGLAEMETAACAGATAGGALDAGDLENLSSATSGTGVSGCGAGHLDMLSGP